MTRDATSGSQLAKSHRFPLRTLRAAVLLPGALVEGALLVLLPWGVTQTSLDTSWLGVLSGSIVAAAMVGNGLAPLTTAWLGSRRMVVAGAFISAVCVAATTAAWVLDLRFLALIMALFAIVADSMADVGFAARMPFIARVCGQPLLKFTSANWLWGIGGAAIGSVSAGWALAEAAVGLLAVFLAGCSLVAAVGLLALLPRDARARPRSASIFHRFGSAAVWTPRAVLLTAGIAWLSFAYGPVDNLLLPARLASEQRDAATFGMMIAAGGIGLAAGLLLTQRASASGDRSGRTRSGLLLIIGIIGMLVQLVLLWWLPDRLLLVAGSFVTAALVAPLLPVLESAILLAVRSAHRTVLLALVGIITSAADLAGTALLGAVAGSAGTRPALVLALVLAGAGALALLALWLFGGAAKISKHQEQ